MEDEFVQVGTWLLPEAYGNDYDHFTQTKCQTTPGVCIAVYAKASDLDEVRRIPTPPPPAPEPFPPAIPMWQR